MHDACRITLSFSENTHPDQTPVELVSLMFSLKQDSSRDAAVLASVNSPRSVCNCGGHTVYKSYVDKPQASDVLCGRGRGFYEHAGNIRMLAIVAGLKSIYQKESKAGKQRIALCAYEGIMNSKDGTTPRFLKRVSDDRWCELQEMEIFKKIHRTLREQKKIVKVFSKVEHPFPGDDYDDDESQSTSTSASHQSFLHLLDPYNTSHWKNNEIQSSSASASHPSFVHLLDPHNDSLWKQNDHKEFLSHSNEVAHADTTSLGSEDISLGDVSLVQEPDENRKQYFNTSRIMEDDGPINFHNNDSTLLWWTKSETDLFLDSMMMDAMPV